MENQYSQETTVTILHESKEWETRFDAPIKEIRVDGQKLNDVHDLALKIDGMTGIIKKLARTATVLAAFTVLLAIGAWLLIWLHHEQLTTWGWSGNWQQNANSNSSPSK